MVLALSMLVAGVVLLAATLAIATVLSNRRSWRARHARVLSEWRHHTRGDLDLILLYPALNIPESERTENFYRAADHAEQFIGQRGYHDAVRELEHAYDLALSGAHRQGTALLTPGEREEHRYAVDLRIAAQDPALPAAVRQTALRKTLDTLVGIELIDNATAGVLLSEETSTSRAGGDDRHRANLVLATVQLPIVGHGHLSA